MRKFIAFTAVFLSILLGGCFYVIFYSHWFPGFLLSRWIQTQYPAFELKSFNYKNRSFHLWDEIAFQEVQLVLKNGKTTQRFYVPSLVVKSDQKKITITIVQAAVEGENLKIKDIGLNLILDFPKDIPMRLRGNFKAASVDFAVYRLEDISMLLEGSERQINFKNVFVRCYGGNIRGEISLDNLSMIEYRVHLQLSGIDLKEMRTISDEAFSLVEGKLDGEIRESGTGNKVDNFTANLNVREGAKLKAYLLTWIVDYIPQSVQRKDLQQLIKTEAYIPIDKAVVQIKNLGEYQLTTTTNLKSDKFNLDLNLTEDINFDTPLGNLIEKIKNLADFMRRIYGDEA
ncbi:MAG TPA: hypothetical protein VJA17_04745 [Candidatus Omnitrophota bacterium]|nr:hypothetical protein [Candidatus Omnitrophota bacterium]